MKINYELLNCLMQKYGNAFYLLDSEQFKKNYFELKKAFTDIYKNFNIAYSYKTNYTPKLCKIVDNMGGYAEVVSDMEMELALRIGVAPQKIIWNGPYKNLSKVKELLLMGGVVNLDSVYELPFIEKCAIEYPNHKFNIGLRCNFDIGDGVISRFGFDIKSTSFKMALCLVEKYSNISLFGLQCHFATRALKTWKPRVTGMLDIIDKFNLTPSHIDLGGGLFGKMPESLMQQFDTDIPTYQEYANDVATIFKDRYKNGDDAPELLIEPGSALVGDCMSFASKVINIKTIRDKSIATLLGSVYNINPTLNKKNPPIKIYGCESKRNIYNDLDFGGFTCIESDYLYRHFDGELAVGDIVVFGNVGSYSVVLKPPFIMPNFPILDLTNNEIKIVKRQEYFDDIFHTFNI